MSVQQFNADVNAWANTTRRKLKLEVLRLVNHTGPSSTQLKVSVKKYIGEASKIAFGFPYYMAFVHKGAGRGYGGSKSGRFTRAKGKKGKTNPNSMGKMGTGKRQPKPWFNPVIATQFPQLAALVSSYRGEKVILNIEKILIK